MFSHSCSRCKNFLREILFRVAARQMRAHDSNDGGIQVLDQFAAGCFIALAHPAQTGRFIKSVA